MVGGLSFLERQSCCSQALQDEPGFPILKAELPTPRSVEESRAMGTLRGRKLHTLINPAPSARFVKTHHFFLLWMGGWLTHGI